MYYTDDVTGAVGSFPTDPGIGWTVFTQQQLDDLELAKAKAAKVVESTDSLLAWRNIGFTYTGSLPGPAVFNLSENSARYADVKSSRRLGGVNKSKFYDITVPRVQRDFVDDTGFDGFVNGINEEEERIMEKYNEYGEQIEEATTVAEVDAITISYAP